MDKPADFGRHPPASPDRDALRAVTGAWDWWRQAGVDSLFSDTATPWIIAGTDQPPGEVSQTSGTLAAAPVAPPSPAPAARPVWGGDRAGWPGSLAAFAPWWLTEAALDGGQQRGRVPPRGATAAALMVVVAQPEAQDSEALLTGPQGRLLTAMLAAMQLTPTQVYFASALPRHTPMADWADLAAQGVGEVLAHHLALAAPQRVITFGRHIPPLLAALGLASPLLHNGPTQSDALLRYVNHEGRSVPLLVARDLGSMLERPIAKGSFWQHWLEWSAGE